MINTGKTIYMSPDGEDKNNGLRPQSPKKTLGSALHDEPITIILLNGTYSSKVNFKPGQEIKDVNLIGMGGVVIDNQGNPPLVIKGNAFIKNISFVNGSYGSLRAYITDTISEVTYQYCKFNSSVADNPDVTKAKSLGGLRIQGGTHYIYRCEASNNAFDGFSYHSAPDDPSGKSSSPHIAEIECTAYNNGTDNDYFSNNASTAHDGAQVLRLNCRYGLCHGPVVADVHNSTTSYNIGCIAFTSQHLENNPDFEANYFAGSGAKLYLLDCKSTGTQNDITLIGNSKIISNKTYPTINNQQSEFRLISL